MNPLLLSFEDHVSQYLSQLKSSQLGGAHRLFEALSYSLNGGGKRFRPTLMLSVSQSLGVAEQKSLPVALAIEMIHTYSLIHDDLPCMDDDDERRGRPSCHKAFDEATALLAGDTLLTHSFLVQSESGTPSEVISAVGRAAGLAGMLGGQELDIYSKGDVAREELILNMHKGKTAALIAVCVESAVLLADLKEAPRAVAIEAGQALGLCFQLKDDLLDKEEDPAERNLAVLKGSEYVESLLKELEENSLNNLKEVSALRECLADYFKWNRERGH